MRNTHSGAFLFGKPGKEFAAGTTCGALTVPQNGRGIFIEENGAFWQLISAIL